MYKVVRIVIGKGDQTSIHEHSTHDDFHVAKKECLKETNKFKQHSFAAYKSGRVKFDVILEEDLNEIFTPDSRRSIGRGFEVAKSYGRQTADIALGAISGATGGVIAGGIAGAYAGHPGTGAAIGGTLGAIGGAYEFSKSEPVYRDDMRRNWKIDDHIRKKYGVDGMHNLKLLDQKEIASRFPVGSRVKIKLGDNEFPSVAHATVMGWDHKRTYGLSLKADGEDKVHTGFHPHRIIGHGSRFFDHEKHYDDYERLKPEVLS